MLAACWYRTPAQVQRDYAQTLVPAATPEAPQRPPEQIKLVRIRAYADRDYQAQTPRWQSHIEDQIDRANRVLEAQLGVAATRPGNHFTPSTMSIPVFALSWRIRLASP